MIPGRGIWGDIILSSFVGMTKTRLNWTHFWREEEGGGSITLYNDVITGKRIKKKTTAQTCLLRRLNQLLVFILGCYAKPHLCILLGSPEQVLVVAHLPKGRYSRASAALQRLKEASWDCVINSVIDAVTSEQIHVLKGTKKSHVNCVCAHWKLK